MNDKGKEMVVIAAYQIAAADGHIETSESRLIEEIADAMGLSKAHLRRILVELENPKIAG